MGTEPNNGNGAVPAPRFVEDLDDLEKETVESGQFVRVKNDPVEIILRERSVMVTKNKFGRDEFRLKCILSKDTPWETAPPKLLAMSKRGMGSLAKAVKAAGIKTLEPGLILRIARVGSGFDTAFRVEVGPAPQDNGTAAAPAAVAPAR